ncbi:MAG: hypothetical protein ACTSVL_10195 [Promethearchaeota archaeon]
MVLGRTARQTRADKPSYIGKKMLGLFGIFFIYSFIYFALLSNIFSPDSQFMQIFSILYGKDPYIWGVSLSFSFIFLSFLFCNDKILAWTFGKAAFWKQIGIFTILMIGSYFLSRYIVIESDFDLYAVLIFLAMIWLIFQSIRLYSGARKGATKIETKLSNHYSPIRYLITNIIPFILLGIMLFLAWVFRYVIVIYTLDYIAVFVPDQSFALYHDQMTRLMPILYIGLMTITIFILAQRMLSRKKGSTARAGSFDNLAFSIICFVLYLYALYNFVLYVFLEPDFLDAVSIVLHSSSSSSGLFIFEFAFTIVFLIWIITDINKQFSTGFLFFTNDGFVMFLIGTIFAQTAARIGLLTGVAHASGSLTDFIKYDYLALPFFIMVFLGITIIMYWIKPHQISMFMRIHKSAKNKDTRSMDVILSFFKREFIRRGSRYLISKEIILSLSKLTGLNRTVLWSLIHRLNKQYLDMQLEEEKDSYGDPIFYFNFIPITQRYQKSTEADLRAKKFVQNQFMKNVQKKQKSKIDLAKGSISSSKQSDLFIKALSEQYSRKVQDEEAIKESQKDSQLIIDRAIDEETKRLVYVIIRQEYLQRAKQVADFPDDFRFRLSDIAVTIEKVAHIPLGRVFPLIRKMAADDWNLNLNVDKAGKASHDNSADSYIELFPVDDFKTYITLREYRPDTLKEINLFMQLMFEKSINFDRKSLASIPPLVYTDDDKEFERSDASHFFAQMMVYFHKNYSKIRKQRIQKYQSKDFQKFINQIIEGKIREFDKHHQLKKNKNN